MLMGWHSNGDGADIFMNKTSSYPTGRVLWYSSLANRLEILIVTIGSRVIA